MSDGTRARRERNQERNAALPRLAELSHLSGALRGRPLVIAGAGPSLGRSFAFLRANALDLPILAVDRAFPRLQDARIFPKMAIILDDKIETQKFFMGRDLDGVLLFANTTANHGSCQLFNDRIFYRTGRELTTSNVAPYPNEVELWKTATAISITCGAVGPDAVLIGWYLGADPLICVGFDMQGTPFLDSQRIFLENIFVPLIRTQSTRPRIINASPGSAWTKGVETVAPEDLQALLTEPMASPGCAHAQGPTSSPVRQ